jgi:hypothetical protein
VVLDGQVQRLAGVNPFVDLANSMDSITWRKVSGALEGVLDPQAGGDERLHGLLRRTIEADREHHQQRRVAS